MKKRKHSEKYIKAVKNSVRLYKVILPCVFIGMLVLGLFVSLLLPLRPSFSENEKRELASFPSFSFSSLFARDAMKYLPVLPPLCTTLSS